MRNVFNEKVSQYFFKKASSNIYFTNAGIDSQKRMKHFQQAQECGLFSIEELREVKLPIKLDLEIYIYIIQ